MIFQQHSSLKQSIDLLDAVEDNLRGTLCSQTILECCFYDINNTFTEIFLALSSPFLQCYTMSKMIVFVYTPANETICVLVFP